MKAPKLPSVNLASPWLLLVVALALGAAASVLAMNYLKFKEAMISKQLEGKRPRMAGVVVPKRDLPKGARLSRDNLAVRQVPEYLISEQMLTPDNYVPMLGKELAFSAEHGKPITRSQVKFAGLGDFADTIAVKRRALTIRVDEINSISGMLRPGDLIDILVSLRDEGGMEVSLPLLSGVAVRAVGQMVEGDEALSGIPQRRDEKVTFTTATLEVTPDEAQRLVLAQDAGKITALLRNPEDLLPTSLTMLNTNQLLSRRPSAKGETVRYYVGGGGKIRMSESAPDGGSGGQTKNIKKTGGSGGG